MENKGESDHSLEILENLEIFRDSSDSSSEKTPFVMTAFFRSRKVLMKVVRRIYTRVCTKMSTEMPTEVEDLCVKRAARSPRRLPRECSRDLAALTKMYTKVCSVNFHMFYYHMLCFLPIPGHPSGKDKRPRSQGFKMFSEFGNSSLKGPNAPKTHLFYYVLAQSERGG